MDTHESLETRVNAGFAAGGHRINRTLLVVDIAQWETVGRVHGEVFAAIRPACTMVEVARLIAPEILVEIEADAFVGAGVNGR